MVEERKVGTDCTKNQPPLAVHGMQEEAGVVELHGIDGFDHEGRDPVYSQEKF